MAEAARLLGATPTRPSSPHWPRRTRAAFNEHYVADDGMVRSDCTTAYALAIVFGLLDARGRAAAGKRLRRLVAESSHRISTGFAGTPYITDALTRTGHLDDAYALLLERECPSWLYPVTMGATTIWERWDSMLPDGTINPGEMTSFNHYALAPSPTGCTARSVVSSRPNPATGRYASPPPGRRAHLGGHGLETPHGRIEVSWRFEDSGSWSTRSSPRASTAVLALDGSRGPGPGRPFHPSGGP